MRSSSAPYSPLSNSITLFSLQVPYRTLSRTSPAIQCHRHWLPCQPTLSMVRTDACRDSYRTFEGAAVEVE
ncbi:hypothetical protein JTE90_002550 [Oedothorax gibbosus]|uniref:Uncharacterized protein n=1 Tax=Oedothorax gibbosus TaxID=931172 RepID=A0AAV6V4T7_9ARAC|nr:hypothetical protein JTE90_002550 [Oedothorax gibbosus]